MKRYYLLLFLLVPILIAALLFATSSSPDYSQVKNDSVSNKWRKVAESVRYPTQERSAGMFDKVTLATNKPLVELATLVGDSNIDAVLRINRIDRDNLKEGMTIIIPKKVDQIKDWQYLPGKINSATSIPKLVIVSQPIQAFGVYENGLLIHSGPVSSGSKLHKTPSGLFFVNWKGEEVVSTFDDEWILKWNMNIDNLEGIAMHQYSLPGYPASHSCIRMTEADAHWLYGWTDQWTWKNGKVVAEGTPVIVYSSYNFDGPPPWTLLPENSKATDTPRSILEDVVKGYQAKIKAGTTTH